jgi:hypothetical protein
VYLTYLVRDTGVKKYPFCGGRFPGINVSHDAEVTVTLDRSLACHDLTPRNRDLPAIVSEGLVGLCHAVSLFALLNC